MQTATRLFGGAVELISLCFRGSGFTLFGGKMSKNVCTNKICVFLFFNELTTNNGFSPCNIYSVDKGGGSPLPRPAPPPSSLQSLHQPAQVTHTHTQHNINTDELNNNDVVFPLSGWVQWRGDVLVI